MTQREVPTRRPTSVTIVVPVYNEQTTLKSIVAAIEDTPVMGLAKQVVLVDNGSTDGSSDTLAEMSGRHTVVKVEQNRGKGHGLRQGFAAATGDVIIVQDADLEYDPAEYPRLLAADPRGQGRRRLRLAVHRRRPHRVLYFWHYVANRALTTAVQHVHEPEPDGHGDLLQGLPPRGASRASRSSTTASASSRRSRPRSRSAGWVFYEVGISYSGAPTRKARRSGDASTLENVWCMVRFGLLERRR